MPGSILNADTGFPKFAGTETTEEKLDTVVNYLYMLLEQLRYSMGNLGAENFNANSLIDLQEMITEPVYIRLENDEGQLAQVNVTAQGLTARLNNFNGVTGSSVEAQFTATAETLSYKITSSEATTIAEQTVAGITLQAIDNSDHTMTSSLKMWLGQTEIASANINLSGLVTFTNLGSSDTTTTIDGGHIKTGTISAITLDSNTITGGTITGATINGGKIASEKMMYYSGGYNFRRTEISGGRIEYSIVTRNTDTEYQDFNPAVAQFVYGRIYVLDEKNSQNVYVPKFYITSAITDYGQEGYPMKIVAGKNMSLDAPPFDSHAGAIYIGTTGQLVNNVNVGTNINIGDAYSKTTISGKVKIAGASSRDGSGWEFGSDGHIYWNNTQKV